MNAAKHMHHEQAAEGIAFAKASNLAAARRGALAFGDIPLQGKAAGQRRVISKGHASMARLFLSYSSKDKQFVLRLSQDLKQAGIEVWLDEWEINVGDDIRQKIEHGISSYEYFGIVLSSSSVSSAWVQRELSAAFMKEMDTRKITVLPLKIQACQIPPLIAGKRYADFSTDYQKGLQDLLKVLRAVHSKNWSLPSVELHTARRGHPEPPQRIVTSCFSSTQWTLFALIESIGDSELTVNASGASAQVMKALFESLVEHGAKLDARFLMSYCFKFVDFAVKEVRNKSAMPSSVSVGAKMALLLRIGNKAYTAKIGDCGGIASWKLEDGDTAFRRVDPTMRVSSAFSSNADIAVGTIAPLGFLQDYEKEIEFGIIETQFENDGDFVALTSFAIPTEKELLFPLYQALTNQPDAESIAKYLCETHEPVFSDCMSAVLTPSSDKVASHSVVVGKPFG